ncbi:MAG: CoA transferase [Chloroflexi bacterium]|nr:CoA transferase [Chloroflexota bacterium]
MDNSFLEGIRVLDLAGEQGFLCGRILGDLGADVIKIEPPGGDPSRQTGPFYHDIPHPPKSLPWFAYNANKRGITLNLENQRGREIFRKLVKSATVVIESYPPGYLKSMGLGYEDLSSANPGMVMTSITPYGQTGPYSRYKASDLTLWCMGGMAYVSGDPDRAPVWVSVPQSYVHAGANAAVGAMIALFHRELTGEGQWVDVSIQEAVKRTLLNARQFWELNGIILKRAGPFRIGLSTNANQRLIWRCKDGYVNYPLIGGLAGERSNTGLVAWMKSEGMSNEHLNDIVWKEFDMANCTQQEFDYMESVIGRFFESHTVKELHEGAIGRRVMLYPVYTTKELREDPQLESRDFWEEVEHPELGETIAYPGSPSLFSGERPKLGRRAPLIGEHNEEIYCGEAGLSCDELAELEREGVI